MLKIVFTNHALKRLKERGISEKEVREFIKNPDKVEHSLKSPKRFLIKKVYFNRKLGRDHLLLIILEKENSILKVITIIDTSKISKYF
jgi:hypothetical protein